MKRAWKAVLAGLFVAAIALPASAATLPSEGFEGFAPGNPFQPINGWAYSNGLNYDVGIAPTGIDGTQSLRISNGTMSGSFGDWVFSPAITAATETPGSQEFIATFDIQSATGAPQDGMSMNVAPQSERGARMTNLRFEDQGDGIHVIFSDVLNLQEVSGYYPAEEDWRLLDIKTLDYTSKHTVTIKMNLLPGPHNDVVQVYIDGSAGLVPGRSGDVTFDGFFAPVDHPDTVNKAKMGQTVPLKFKASAPSFATSWEDYYRYNSESNAALVQIPQDPDVIELLPEPWDTRQVDSLIFQARCAAAGPCANASAKGNGFWLDNVTYSSGAIVNPLPVAAAPVTDPAVFGAQPFKSTKLACNELDGPGDAIETYSTNALGLKYTGDGIWHYNWQTKQPGTTVGSCVKMELTIQPDLNALFTFTK